MSIDRREDAGDFYLGGKVISTRPVATGGDVKHSDFAGMDVKTNTIPDLREAVRELGRRLGATVVTALSACVAVAATVQTVPVNDLDFDANPSIVTNVVFDAPPDFSTNNTELVETIEATAPAPGNYAVVSNAAVYAATTNALQDAELESHASQLSQLSQSIDGKVPTSRTINGKALTSNISLSADEVGATTPEDVTAAIREQSLGGIWDETLQVWWTPRMRNGSLTYEATTNVNLNAEN